MKKLLLIVFPLLLFTSFLVAQVPENNTVRFHFFKVDDDKQAEYETVMKDYYGPIMKERVKNGCLQNWVFRRVLPGTNARNYFTHVTIDVLNPGKNNYQCEKVTAKTVFPTMSEGMHNLMAKVRTSRKVVYRTSTSYVTGFNKNDSIPTFAAFNFIRTKPGKLNDYKNMHLEYQKDNFMKYSNQLVWHALVRNDARSGGSAEWNYLTIDGYDTMSQKRNRSVNVPEKLSKEINKKYGSFIDMRDLKHQVVTRLIMAASE